MLLTSDEYKELQKYYLELGEEALSLNHYQLSEQTGVNALKWRAFLQDPRTVDYINTEMSIIRNAAINQMVQEAPHSRSVGQSQLLNALQKIEENTAKKEGPAFIYCYVPLNPEQKHARNVRQLYNTDGFEIEQTEEGVWEVEEE